MNLCQLCVCKEILARVYGGASHAPFLGAISSYESSKMKERGKFLPRARREAGKQMTTVSDAYKERIMLFYNIRNCMLYGSWKPCGFEKCILVSNWHY